MAIHFKFDDELAYQMRAVQSTVSLFDGLEAFETRFSMPKNRKGDIDKRILAAMPDAVAYANHFNLSPERLLQNLNNIQCQNSFKQSQNLAPEVQYTVSKTTKNNRQVPIPLSNEAKTMLQYDIEMETGTGKTYVYLRTIYELFFAYRLKKFIILVPSRAIREGVAKTIKQLSESKHFVQLCTKREIPIVEASATIYAGQVDDVKNFAENPGLSIMVMTVNSLNNTSANLNKTYESLGDLSPISILSACHPCVIVDEPQVKSSTTAAQNAIATLKPCFVLNYSATHKVPHLPVYRLGPVESYEKHLVKRIEVAACTADADFTQAYLCLKEVKNENNHFVAYIDCNCINANGRFIRAIRKFEYNSNNPPKISDYITRNPIYGDMRIGNMTCDGQNSRVEILNTPTGTITLQLGHSVNANARHDESESSNQSNKSDINASVAYAMIQRTIREHLDKELERVHLGYKVLSLFFLDEVKNYRVYDGDDSRGLYAQYFEEIYNNIIKEKKYESLRKRWPENKVSSYHDGYFAKDGKGRFIDKGKNDDTDGAETSTYQLIMQDKEKLLDLNCPLRFIFSHSALQEGWDNPNVFQICVFAAANNNSTRRQRIGRGLRLPVNQKGERNMDNLELNKLTVIANEAFEEFADALQKDYDKDGVRFGIVDEGLLYTVIAQDGEGNIDPDKAKVASAFIEDLKKKKLIDANGKPTKELKKILQDGTLQLPDGLSDVEKEEITNTLKKVCEPIRIPITDANKKEKSKVNPVIYQSDDFKELWKRIRPKTSYSIQMDGNALIQACIESIREATRDFPALELKWTSGELHTTKLGFTSSNIQSKNEDMKHYEPLLPDILRELQRTTHLTRRTIVEILTKSETLECFIKNPALYLETVSKTLEETIADIEVNSIFYEVSGEVYNRDEIFESREVNPNDTLVVDRTNSNKSLYNWVECDSDNEKRILDLFEQFTHVKMYTKLPIEFKIKMPFMPEGYNPDWALIVEDKQGNEKLYFVYESKGTDSVQGLRGIEKRKIDCAKKHFEAIGVKFDFGSIDKAERLFC